MMIKKIAELMSTATAVFYLILIGICFGLLLARLLIGWSIGDGWAELTGALLGAFSAVAAAEWLRSKAADQKKLALAKFTLKLVATYRKNCDAMIEKLRAAEDTEVSWGTLLAARELADRMLAQIAALRSIQEESDIEALLLSTSLHEDIKSIYSVNANPAKADYMRMMSIAEITSARNCLADLESYCESVAKWS